MLDQYGRRIDYLRISITDRCNLHCRYCMSSNVDLVHHEDILHYEEILRICRAAARLGITKFKVTGGEPQVLRRVQPCAADEHGAAQAVPVLCQLRRPARAAALRRDG